MKWMTLLVLALVTSTGFADEGKKKFTLRQWFEHLKQGLSESSVQGRYQKKRVTAVAAVRGDRQDSISNDKPAWKSGRKTKRDAQIKKERAEFAKAVELIMEGKSEEGVKGLEAFETAYPESHLLQDVREAKAKALEWGKEAAAEAPEEKPTEKKD